LESPATGQAESLGAACHEGDREPLVGAAGIAQPKAGRSVLRRQREQEWLGRRVFAGVLGDQRRVDVEGARSVGGGADVEQA
jgi:hypothetical protein